MWAATLFSVRGIFVKVHVSFLLVVALGATQWGVAHGVRGALFGAAFTLALFSCVLLHELGHGLVAQHFGLRVKEVLLLPIGGIATVLGKAKSARQEVLIAVAGPAVNLMVAACLGAFLWLSGISTDLVRAAPSKLEPSTSSFLVLLTAGNVLLALFNLLPFYPLDGGRVLRALLAFRFGESRGTGYAAAVGQAAGAFMVVAALLLAQLVLGLVGLFLFIAATRERVAASLHTALHSLRAADVAEVPAVELDARSRIGEAATQLLRTTQESFPVVGDRELVGVVTRAELQLAALRPELAMHSIRTLARKVPELPSHLSVAHALDVLEQMDATLGVVVTPDYPLGFISPGQVLAKLGQLGGAWPMGKEQAKLGMPEERRA